MKPLRIVAMLIVSVQFCLATAEIPGPSIIQNACPFECCQYGAWEVLVTVALYDSPNGSHVVATVSKGDKVTVETGEEHIAPLRIDVVYPTKKFKTGDVLYTTHHYPECGLGYYLNGEEAQGENACLDDGLPQELSECKKPSESCWGKVSGPVGKNDVWWVRIRTKGGKIGWTRETEQFSGRDSCA